MQWTYLVFEFILRTSVSSHAKSAVIIMGKPTTSVFFSSSYDSLSHPRASLHMLVCWKVPKFSSLDAGSLCPSEHVCVVYLLQLPLQLSLPKQLHRAQHCSCKGTWTRGTEKTGSSLKPSPLALQSLFPCKIWHLTLTRTQCGPARYKLSLRRNSSLSYICESFHSHLFFSRQQSLLWAHFNPPAELLCFSILRCQ